MHLCTLQCLFIIMQYPFLSCITTKQLTRTKGKLKCCLVFPHHVAPWELQLAMQRAELCPPSKHKRAALPSRALQHQLPVVAPAEMLTASPRTSVVDSYCYYCSSLYFIFCKTGSSANAVNLYVIGLYLIKFTNVVQKDKIPQFENHVPFWTTNLLLLFIKSLYSAFPLAQGRGLHAFSSTSYGSKSNQKSIADTGQQAVNIKTETTCDLLANSRVYGTRDDREALPIRMQSNKNTQDLQYSTSTQHTRAPNLTICSVQNLCHINKPSTS